MTMAQKARRPKKGSKKKSVKRKVLRKRPVKKKNQAKKKTKSAKRKKTAKKPSVKKGPKLPAEPVGRVTHYFPKVKAAAVMIERENLRVGDTLYFKGHTTHFKQTVDSLQMNHQSVAKAAPGDEVGIQVKSRTREHDFVFKL